MMTYLERDDQTYVFICEYLIDNGYPPTQQEIADALGVAPGLVLQSIIRLEDKGRIWREFGKIRNIRVKDDKINLVAIRLERPDADTQLLEDIYLMLRRMKSRREREGQP